MTNQLGRLESSAPNAFQPRTTLRPPHCRPSLSRRHILLYRLLRPDHGISRLAIQVASSTLSAQFHIHQLQPISHLGHLPLRESL